MTPHRHVTLPPSLFCRFSIYKDDPIHSIICPLRRGAQLLIFCIINHHSQPTTRSHHYHNHFIFILILVSFSLSLPPSLCLLAQPPPFTTNHLPYLDQNPPTPYQIRTHDHLYTHHYRILITINNCQKSITDCHALTPQCTSPH